jgi:hypothetical protein
MSSVCCRSISSRVITQLHVERSFDLKTKGAESSMPFGRASGPGPSSYRPTKEAGAMARQGALPRNYHSSGTHLTGDDLLPSHWM